MLDRARQIRHLKLKILRAKCLKNSRRCSPKCRVEELWETKVSASQKSPVYYSRTDVPVSLAA